MWMSCRTVPKSVLSLAIALVVTASAGAQERRQAGPSPYDLSREATVKGTVVRAYTMPSPANADVELSILAVTIDGQPIQLILGPAEFVKTQKVTFAAGSAVEVTGTPGARLNSEAAMMVRKVKSGSQTLTLRDQTGKALWAGSGGR